MPSHAVSFPIDSVNALVSTRTVEESVDYVSTFFACLLLRINIVVRFTAGFRRCNKFRRFSADAGDEMRHPALS